MNTFQAVIASDEMTSFAIFNYKRIDWIMGTESDVPAQVGLSLTHLLKVFFAENH